MTRDPIDYLNPPDDLPLAGKWYARSGSLGLTVDAPLGPVDACQRLVYMAIEANRLCDLGAFIWASQVGFGIQHAQFVRPTQRYVPVDMALIPKLFPKSESE